MESHGVQKMAEEKAEAIVATGLVLNFLDVAVTTPIEILPGCVLRRATDEEVSSFRETISASGLDGVHVLGQLEGEPPVAYGKPWTPLKPEQWRYWVIETTLSSGLHDVARASRLADIELPCNHLFINLPRPKYMGASMRASSDIFCNFVPFGLPQPRLLDSDAVEQIREIGRGFTDTTRLYPSVARSIVMYHQLGLMGGAIAADYSFTEKSLQAPLYVLGVFAVIESILTHAPVDRGDSLTRQIKAKMNLLNARFSKPLDYSVFGGSPKSDSIWSKLYSFRSAIAHGGEPTFDSGDLQVLKDQRTTVTFLDGAAKALLRHALKEPELIRDLQAC